MNQDFGTSLQGEGTTTRVAREGINVFSTARSVSFGTPHANDLASFVVLIIAERIVKVLPNPISSARIPPPVSLGISFFSKPVMECIYLNYVSHHWQAKWVFQTHEF
jgi:hypothetical protein